MALQPAGPRIKRNGVQQPGRRLRLARPKGEAATCTSGADWGNFFSGINKHGGYVWMFMDIHRYLWIVMDIWYGLLAKTRSPTLNFHQVSSYKQLLETGIDSSHYAVGLASETGPRVSSQSFSIQLGHGRFLIPNCGYGTHERVHLLTLKVVCLFFFLFSMIFCNPQLQYLRYAGGILKCG